EDQFLARVNPETLTVARVGSDHWAGVLEALVDEHLVQTESPRAAELMRHWQEALGHFWQVCPTEMLGRLEHPLSDTGALAEA
ncbi:MAG: hypothetical protein AAF908_11615, partial [Pseudomonadota bacterium]